MGADAASEEFAVAGLGLQEPPTAAAEGFDGESMVSGDAGPPAHGGLGDAIPQPAVVDPSSSEGTDGESEPAAAVLTLEQRGAAIRAVSRNMREVRSGWPRATRRSLRRQCRVRALSQQERAGR